MADLFNALDTRWFFSRNRDDDEDGPGIMTKNGCPEGSDEVQCCVFRDCTVPEGRGLCKGIKHTKCSGGQFFSGTDQSRPCPGSDDNQCCVKDKDISSPAPSPAETSEDRQTTVTETSSLSLTTPSPPPPSSDPPTLISSSSSDFSISPTITTTSSLTTSLSTTPTSVNSPSPSPSSSASSSISSSASPPASPSSRPQTISLTSSPPSESTVDSAPSNSNAELSRGQIGGIAAGSVTATIAIVFLLLYLLMYRARSRYNEKLARENAFYRNMMPPELPDSSGGTSRFVSNPYAIGSATAFGAKLRPADVGMGIQTIPENDTEFPGGAVISAPITTSRNSRRYELESGPAYRTYRSRPAVLAAELDGSPIEIVEEKQFV
ncbi:predicted protein [Uncinocarpus reesii 1704]|uniref:Mid2 domain-containing protein n=1 Tax=Uncinocarpus reesii (strain UAMH 1704) TaxID=336963 RepID=C4JJX6_UNCRE|nr:uncharacterized protein UREG_01933 [Uncinocarpus reesii 1704]EEP77084.1 predicted protein [Uncinocarpus reesii 1704]